MHYYLIQKLPSAKKLAVFFKKSLALTLALLLLTEPCLHAMPPAVADKPLSTAPAEETKWARSFLNTQPQNVLLGKAGTLEETYLPNRGSHSNTVQEALSHPTLPLVILLQDAHGVLSAQKNIGKLLHRLTKESGLKEPWIALEGTEPGEINHQALSRIPDAKIRKRTALHFMKTAQMDGADYFTAAYAPQTRYFGIDSLEGIGDNVQSYRELLRVRPSAQKFIADWETLLTQLKKRVYPADLYILDQQMLSFRENMQNPAIEKLLLLVQEFSRKFDLALETYPTLQSVCELNRPQRTDSRGGAKEKSAEELQQLRNSIRVNHFTDELQAWRESLENQLTKDLPEARSLAAVSRTLQFHKHLLLLSLTPQEKAAFFAPKNLSIKKALAQTRFLRFLFQQDRLPLWQKSDLRAFHSARREALRFYDAAEEREPILERETQTLLNQAPNHKLFVILGGFHREHFTQTLRDQQIAYLVLSPSITKDFGQQAYWHQLAGAPLKALRGAAGTHLKLRASWRSLTFPAAVTAYALRQTSQAPSASFLNYQRWAAALPAPSGVPKDLYADVLPEGRSEVRSSSGSSDSSSSVRSVSQKLDFSHVQGFYTALIEEIFSGSTHAQLTLDTLSPFTSRYTTYLSQALLNNPVNSMVENSSLLKQSLNTVQVHTDERTLSTKQLKGETYQLNLGVSLFTEIAATNPDFSALFFILSLHHYFTRPVIKQKLKELPANLLRALSVEQLLKIFFSGGPGQKALLDWDTNKRQEFVNVIAAQLQSTQGSSESTASTTQLLDRIAKVLKVEVPAMPERSLLLTAETTYSTSPAASAAADKDPAADARENKDLTWFQHILNTGEVIGSGGFGVAVRGMNYEIKTSPIVAKLISPTFKGSDTLPEKALKSLTLEANVLGQLNGDHAPRVIRRFNVEFFIPVTGDLPEVARKLGFESYRGKTVSVGVIVMDMAEGENLEKILQELPNPAASQTASKDAIQNFNHWDQRLWASIKEAARAKKLALRKNRLALALAKAVEAVHNHGLLHRDIKPGNIFFKGDDEAQLIDFGLSHMRQTPTVTSAREEVKVTLPNNPAVPFEPTAAAVSPIAAEANLFKLPADAALPIAGAVDQFEKTVIGVSHPVEAVNPFEKTGAFIALPVADKADVEKFSEPADVGATQAGEVIGTLSYLLNVTEGLPRSLINEIPPDRQDSKGLTAWRKNFGRTEAPDLWALGAVLYHLFTGQTPAATIPQNRNLLKKLAANTTGDYPNPRQINPEITPQEQYIILRLMGTLIPGMPPSLRRAFLEYSEAPQRFNAHYQPLPAYSNAAEAVRDLEALVAGKPLPSAPSRFFGIHTQTKKWPKRFQRFFDFIFRSWARDYTIHTLEAPNKILDKAAKARYLKGFAKSAEKPVVQDLAQKQKQAARQRAGWTAAATLAILFSSIAAAIVIALSFWALSARLNPPAPPRPEAEIVYKEVLVPAPETEKPFEWSMDIKNLLPYATVPQDPNDPKNTERVLKQKQNVQFLAYSSSVADPNPDEGNPEGRNYLARRAFERLPNGYYPVEYAVNKIPVPIGINTHAEIITSVYFKAESDNNGHGNLTLGIHDFENKTMRALFTFLTDGLAVGKFRLDRASPFTMDFDGGTDTEIRAAYDAARKNPLIQPNVPPNYWHPIRIIKYAQGEPLPDGTSANGQTAVFTIGEKDNPKSPLIVHTFSLANNPTDPWPETIQLTFYISGTQDFARQGPVDIRVEQPNAEPKMTQETAGAAATKTPTSSSTTPPDSVNRSEVRHTTTAALFNKMVFSPQLAAVLPGEKTGLLWIEYNAANIEHLSQQFISKSALAFRSGARVLFVQQRGAENPAVLSPDLRRRMKLYGAAFAETDLTLEQLTPDSLDFESLMLQSQRLFGNSLGRPVILGSFTRGAPIASALTEAQSVYYRVDLSKFSEEDAPAYRNAVLLSASRLSKQFADPLEVVFNSDSTVSVSQSFVTWVSQAYEQILHIAYSA